MEGLILHEDSEYVTYLCPIFDALGDELISRLNWRIISPECGVSLTDTYSFEGKNDSWISGAELVKEVRAYPDIQWWWGLLQGFPDSVSRDDVFKNDPVDIQDDPLYWENPVTMRDPNALIEIEAFDSSLTIVLAKDDHILESLKKAFPNYELLSDWNESLTDGTICEKCGSVMVPIDPDKPVGMKCPECGWGWATTYIEPKYEDETVYKIVLDHGSDATKENIKAIAKVMSCNFLRAREVVNDDGHILAEGKATEVEGFIQMLLQSSVKYHIEPEWPY